MAKLQEAQKAWELQQLMIETQRPFIEQMVAIYNTSLPRLTIQDGGLVKAEYPAETETLIAEIRKHMKEACDWALIAAIRSRRPNGDSLEEQ